LEAPPQEVEGPLAIGADIYSVSCASCHGSAGGGGVGPALSGGEVLLTFPDFESQVAWVVAGSPAAGVPFGDPNRPGGGRVAQGGMPGFGGSLTADELLAVVLYERVEHGGQAEDELAALETLAQTEGLDLTTAVSGDDVRALLAELGLESGELAAE
ncbi:MAG: cytochrome c, partial [Acidimicrobiia bacterium]|nr:cytochrome c [Acidimicrobiia bacterium]